MSEQACTVEWLQPGIRGIDEEDLERIQVLYNQFFLGDTPPTITMRQLVRSAGYERIAVARRGSATTVQYRPIVGMGTMYVLHAIGGDNGRIGEFVVDEQERRRGVGATLVGFMVHEARKLGCLQLRLTSDGRRLDAHRFWEGRGFSFKDSKVMRMQL